MTRALPHSLLASRSTVISRSTVAPHPSQCEAALTLVECVIALCLTLLVVTEALSAARTSLYALKRARDVRQALSLAEELFYAHRFEGRSSIKSTVCSPELQSESFVFLRCAPRALSESQSTPLPAGGRGVITTLDDFYTWSPQ